MKDFAKNTHSFFDIREAGSSLEEAAVDVVKSEGHSLTNHWYHSPLEVDVYYWVDEKRNIIKQQVSIYGQICEWDIIDGVRTGCVIETGKEDENEGNTIQYDKKAHNSSLFQAKNLLEYTEAMSSLVKEQLIYNFEHNPTADNLDPEELLAQYGDKAKELKGSLAKFIKKLFK
ncbi:MAG: hypothetical protein H6625_08815 [Bdellovibrionaceae bacterium]|nr:hypothetical protein [Pseudobdellovibrionaceae bacterium]MCB9092894.1 hypothetical protein [Halobacteriovoraceae bacterium]